MFKVTHAMHQHYLHSSSSVVHGFAQLLTHCTFACASHTSGLTWLELFLLSVAFSTNPLSVVQSDSAH